MKAIIGTKLGMTQLFDAEGNVARVTLIEAGPCVVTQLKTTENDGYQAVQIGYGKAKHPGKAQAGHLKASGAESNVLREIRQDGEFEVKLGDKIDVSSFEIGDEIQVTGISKGKGFAGVIKRHNFNSGRKTHGSHAHRGHGSIGSGYPQHVLKAVRMAGRMGGEQVTISGLKVVVIDAENNLLAVSGPVPGPKRGVIMVKAS